VLTAKLEELDALLHMVREDTEVMEGLSILERQAIISASQTISSLIWKHLHSSKPPPEASTE